MIASRDMIALRSAAKLNLTLDIVGKRPDGYHELRSVVQTVGVWDEVELRRADGPATIRCNWPELESPGNLCLRAAESLAAAAGIPCQVHIDLSKRIPVGAGLGGGSGNAAAALVGLNELWNLRLSPEELSQIAARIGADVPYFLIGGMALMEGVGDRLTPLDIGLNCHFVIAKGRQSVSTAWAYQQFDLAPQCAAGEPRQLLDLLRANRVDKAAALFKNVMEKAAAAACPEVTVLKGALLQQGALGAAMSGSGSAVFGAFQSEPEARQAWLAVSTMADAAFVAAPTRTGVEMVNHSNVA